MPRNTGVAFADAYVERHARAEKGTRSCCVHAARDDDEGQLHRRLTPTLRLRDLADRDGVALDVAGQRDGQAPTAGPPPGRFPRELHVRERSGFVTFSAGSIQTGGYEPYRARCRGPTRRSLGRRSPDLETHAALPPERPRPGPPRRPPRTSSHRLPRRRRRPMTRRRSPRARTPTAEAITAAHGREPYDVSARDRAPAGSIVPLDPPGGELAGPTTRIR